MKWKKKLFSKFINPYIFMVLITVALAGVAGYATKKILTDDMIQKHTTMVDFVNSYVDNHILEIEQLAYELDFSKQIPLFDSLNIKNDVLLANQLSVIQSSSGIIQTIGVYYPDSDRVISDSGPFTVRCFYRLYHQDNADYYASYLEQLAEQPISTFKIFTDTGRLDGPVNDVYYYYTLKNSSDSEKMPVIIIKIDMKKINNLIGELISNTSECFAILNEEVGVITITGNEELLEHVDPMKIDDYNDITAKVVGDHVVYYGSSAYQDINYLSITQQNGLMSALFTSYKVMFVGVALVFLIDLIISVYSSKKYRKSFSRIIGMMQENPEKSVISDNPFSYIESNIQSMIDKNETLSNQLNRQETELCNTFLAEALKGDIQEEAVFAANVQKYKLNFVGDYFGVLIFDSLDKSLIYENIEEFRSRLEYAAKKCSNTYCQATLCVLDDFYCMIISQTEEEMQHCRAFITELSSCLIQEFQAGLQIGCGNVYKGYAQIPISYSEAKSSLKYLANSERSGMLVYADLPKEFLYKKSDSLDLLAKVVNCIKLQDYENCIEVIPALFSCIDEEGNEEAAKATLFIAFMMLEEASVSFERMNYHYYYRCLASGAADNGKLQKAVLELLEELKSMKQEKILINFDKKIVMIKNYIDENFCDPNIGLNLLSEHFSMNNSYLSKVFKKSFGVGVLEYINKLRIEKSKQMLIDTNLSLLQISESIGYISDITFIRIFKRYEGTTPGKFREAMSPNDS